MSCVDGSTNQTHDRGGKENHHVHESRIKRVNCAANNASNGKCGQAEPKANPRFTIPLPVLARSQIEARKGAHSARCAVPSTHK